MPPILCPISDFPYMLPECVPVGSLLALSSVIPLLMVAWQLWMRRLRTGLWGQKVSGRVCGAGDRGELVFQQGGPRRLFTVTCCTGEQVLVAPGYAEILGWPRRVSIGCRVTVVGVAGVVRRSEEHLYRQSAAQPGLEAVRIIREGWPPFRWLTPLVVGGWLLFAGGLMWYCRWSQVTLGALAIVGD